MMNFPYYGSRLGCLRIPEGARRKHKAIIALSRKSCGTFAFMPVLAFASRKCRTFACSAFFALLKIIRRSFIFAPREIADGGVFSMRPGGLLLFFEKGGFAAEPGTRPG